MLNEKIKEVEKRLCKEFDELLAKPTWTPQELEYANKLVDMPKDSTTIDAMNEHSYEGYEPYSNLMQKPYYDNMPNGSYDHTNQSMRRGRSPMTGRYVSHDNYGGQSGHSIKDRAIAMLEGVMDTTQSPYEQQELGNIIEQVRNGR